MILIGGKRYCGKTTELINIASTNQIPIIVLNKQRGKFIQYIAKEKGKKVETISFTEIDKIIGMRINEILIDDLEDILSHIFFGRKIIAAATSTPFKPMEQINKRK